MSSYDQLFKLVIIGDTATGKSCFLDYKPLHVQTIGVEFQSRMCQVDGKTMKLQVWDTSGSPQFRTITNSYCHGVNGAIVVYDITNEESFTNLDGWVKEMGICKPIVVVGTKCDLESHRVVTWEQGENFAKERGYLFLETSTKTGANVDELFSMCAREMYKALKEIYPNI